MRPRRVLQITRFVEGGSAVVLDLIARGLDRNRYEPLVLFDTHVDSNIRKNLSHSDIKTIDFKECSNGQMPGLQKSFKNSHIKRRIRTHFSRDTHQIYLSIKASWEFLRNQAPIIYSFVKVFRNNGVDLIHTHSDLCMGKPEIFAAWLIGIPCISHLHAYPVLNYFDRIFAHFVNGFIYISEDVAKFHTTQGIPKTKGKIIHNGVDINKFDRNYHPDSVREEFGLKSNQILVGLIGRIDWWKGHEYFIEAMSMVTKQNPDIRGLIIGGLEKSLSLNRNRQYLKNLNSLIESLNLTDKIIFTGFRDDVPRLISALDMVVHASSRPEPFGLVITEAMAAGKPVVATAAGGVPEIIKNGVNGLLVPCRDSVAMSEAILKTVLNPDKARQMGNSARRHAIKKFTTQHQIMAIQKLYDDILINCQRRKKPRDLSCISRT